MYYFVMRNISYPSGSLGMWKMALRGLFLLALLLMKREP